MNITNYIKNDNDLVKLPFLTVYQTILILLKNGIIDETRVNNFELLDKIEYQSE